MAGDNAVDGAPLRGSARTLAEARRTEVALATAAVWCVVRWRTAYARYLRPNWWYWLVVGVAAVGALGIH
jgi:hypothetical protein